MNKIKIIFNKEINFIQNRKGMTFLEIMVGFALAAIALGGMFQLLQMSLNVSYRANQEIIATNLASGLMAEIMSRDFVEAGLSCSPTYILGIDSGESISIRSTFDDVDDYNGYNESPPCYVNGTQMEGPYYSAFRRSVIVDFADETNNFASTGSCTEYKLVTVTVTGPYVRPISISEVKSSL